MKKVRYGVIGIKGVGRLHIASVQENPHTELTALADINAELVKKKSREFGVRAFVDYRQMLDAGIVDAVSIATPHYLLAPIALDCLNAGVHVFIEKPFAIRISEADAVIRIANAKGLKLCVGYVQRTFRAAIAIKQLLEEGAIGNLMRVLWTWQEFRPESYYAPDPWRGTFREAGGGVLMSQASHQLDLLCWTIGKPIRVSALIGNQLHNAEIEDIVSANVLFSNGALGSLQFNINQARGYSVRQLAGDKGLIVIQDLKSLAEDENDEKILLGLYEENLRKAVSELPGDWDQPAISWRTLKLSDSSPLRDFLAKLSGDHLASHALLMKGRTLLERIGFSTKEQRPMAHSLLMNSFIDAILNGGESIVSGESARSATELLNALMISAVRKKTVDLPIDPDEYDCLADELRDGQTRVPMLHQS